MEWDVVEVKVQEDQSLFVRFKDGVQGTVKFTHSFFSGVFSHLIQKDEFKKVKLVNGVVTWDGELDLAPDAMYDEIKKNGQWTLS